MKGPETGKLFALGSAHVSAPHRFRHYYPADWLTFVKDHHVRCRFEVLQSEQETTSHDARQVPLTEMFRHAELDVAAVPILNDASDGDGTLVPLLQKVDETSVSARVSICGHELEGDAGSGNEKVLPISVAGEVVDVDGNTRAFVETEIPTVMGMCGGPVLGPDGVCIGMLEGLIPSLKEGEKAMSQKHAKLAGCSVIITADELRHFITDIERELGDRGSSSAAKPSASRAWSSSGLL